MRWRNGVFLRKTDTLQIRVWGYTKTVPEEVWLYFAVQDFGGDKKDRLPKVRQGRARTCKMIKQVNYFCPKLGPYLSTVYS